MTRTPIKGNIYRSACIVFFIAGFVLACWSPLVPILKERLSLSDGAMGLVLLLFGIGSLIAMPGTGYVAGIVGCRRVLTVTVPGAAIILFLLGLAHDIFLLSALLFLFGVFVGATDVVVNVNAALAQTLLGRPIMSSMHALFSLGAFAGAGTVSLGIYLGEPLEIFLFAIVASVIVLYALVAKGISAAANKDEAVSFSWPTRSIVALGIGCWIAYLVEGAMLDWSGIYLVAHTHSNARVAGFAFTSFSLAMMIGRFVGDRGVEKLGTDKMFRLSAVLLLVGLVGMVTVKGLIPLLVALVFVGLGLANIAPLLFFLASQSKSEAVAHAIAQVSTMGYAGILLGPALIGGIASLTSITGAFCFMTLIVLLLCVGVFARASSKRV